METDNKSKARLLDVMGKVNPSFVNESSVNRIEHWINTHDIAGISAFRGSLINTTPNTWLDIEIGNEYTKAQNIKRSYALKASLLKLRYGVTKISGLYIESGQNEVQEESFIVVNIINDPNFKENVFKLSEYFNQDSFLYKERSSDRAILVGTNNDGYIGYGNEKDAGLFYKRVTAQFMSRIGSQGFAFSNNDNPISNDAPLTFKDRKPKEIDLNEVCTKLNIQRFDKIENVGKHALDITSKPILERLLINCHPL